MEPEQSSNLHYEELTHMVRHYTILSSWAEVQKARATKQGKLEFWRKYKRRRRNFIFRFNGMVYCASGKITVAGSGNVHVFRNDEQKVEICSSYTDVDMLALNGAFGRGAQIRAARITNYGETSVDSDPIELTLAGKIVHIKRGDVGFFYGEPNAGKNAMANALAEQAATQNLKSIMVPGFETRLYGVKSIAAWLEGMDRAAERADIIFGDGLTDLAVLGKVAKSTHGNDNEHVISLPGWFSGLAAEKKIVALIGNSMDLEKTGDIESRRKMYTGKFSFVFHSKGKESNYDHVYERGSGFGSRVPIVLKDIGNRAPDIEMFELDGRMLAGIQEADEQEDASPRVLAPARRPLLPAKPPTVDDLD